MIKAPKQQQQPQQSQPPQIQTTAPFSSVASKPSPHSTEHKMKNPWTRNIHKPTKRTTPYKATSQEGWHEWHAINNDLDSVILNNSNSSLNILAFKPNLLTGELETMTEQDKLAKQTGVKILDQNVLHSLKVPETYCPFASIAESPVPTKAPTPTEFVTTLETENNSSKKVFKPVIDRVPTPIPSRDVRYSNSSNSNVNFAPHTDEEEIHALKEKLLNAEPHNGKSIFRSAGVVERADTPIPTHVKVHRLSSNLNPNSERYSNTTNESVSRMKQPERKQPKYESPWPADDGLLEEISKELSASREMFPLSPGWPHDDAKADKTPNEDTNPAEHKLFAIAERTNENSREQINRAVQKHNSSLRPKFPSALPKRLQAEASSKIDRNDSYQFAVAQDANTEELEPPKELPRLRKKESKLFGPQKKKSKFGLIH